MMTVWSCYEAFKNIAYSLSWEDGLIEQACQQHPDWCVAGLSLPGSQLLRNLCKPRYQSWGTVRPLTI
jgi:hypothetical protein